MAITDKVVRTFDASTWAKSFKEIVIDNKIVIDEDLMLSWFANAIMCGYDEAQKHIENEKKSYGDEIVKNLTIQEIRGRVYQGWCSDENKYKEMDVVLAEAITQAIIGDNK